MDEGLYCPSFSIWKGSVQMARGIVKPTDSMVKIQDALNKYDIISFQKGVYKITQTLSIPSNRILLMEGAVLRRYFSKPLIMTACNEKTKAYNGACNIKIVGGTIEGMNDCGYSASDMVLLFHSDNVAFLGVTFLDNTGSHAIDIGGCRNTEILGCKFLGCKSVGKDFREAIQIDYAYSDGIPYFVDGSPCFDDTHCEGVNIIGCTFDKSPTYEPQYVAIGTHAQTDSEKYHKDIVIKGNFANGNGISPKSYGFFVRLVNMRNVEVSENVISNYGRLAFIDSSVKTTAKDKGCRNIRIERNVILDSPNDFKASSVYAKGTADNRIINLSVTCNRFDKKGATSYKYCTSLTEKNNTVV